MAQPLSYVPCEPWATVDQWCCPEGSEPITSPCNPPPPGPPVPPVFTKEILLDMASELLFAASGYMFPGVCTLTVEYGPQCDPGCGFPTSGYSGWITPSFPNVLQNNFSGCRCCARIECLPPALTHYPMISVTEIIEDGVVLDLAAAGVHIGDYNHICRRTGKWGACTTRVAFTYGRTPPLHGQMAALKLACALSAACNPDPCNSNEVTGFTAAGRTYNLLDIRQALAEGTIPIAEVQLFLGVYGKASTNPYVGRVWSVELERRSPRIITFVAP